MSGERLRHAKGRGTGHHVKRQHRRGDFHPVAPGVLRGIKREVGTAQRLMQRLVGGDMGNAQTGRDRQVIIFGKVFC